MMVDLIKNMYNQLVRSAHTKKVDRINKKWIKEQNGIYKIQEIEIETINRCNGTCSFCPVNANACQRSYAKMSDELFRKIIEDLKSMDYRGYVSLFSNNEPFLDSRIIDMHKYCYEMLPNAKHRLYTNGSLLSLDRFLEIIPYLDVLHINNYNDNMEVNPQVKDVYDYINEHTEYKKKVQFVFRKQTEILLSRAGQAPNKQGTTYLDQMCLLPFRMMIVRPDGKVSLCCNDALGKYTLGDLNIQTVEEVWNSKQFNGIREKLINDGRKNLHLCNACDSESSPMEVI